MDVPILENHIALWFGGTNEPYFLEDEEGEWRIYHTMIRQFFVLQLEGIAWFQQDGATCNTTRETLTASYEFASGRVISRFGDQNWPSRSCDLVALDFWLWDYLKSQVYANKPATTEALKAEIRALSINRNIYTKMFV